MLKLESVKISYGAIEAVKGVSLDVREGEVVTIIGANGAGKSTLLKAIVGLEPVGEGRVLIDGKDCTTVPGHKRVGLGVAMSPEGRGVFADQTVRENLMLGAYSRKGNSEATEAAIEREIASICCSPPDIVPESWSWRSRRRGNRLNSRSIAASVASELPLRE